jgi:hypothetical protein
VIDLSSCDDECLSFVAFSENNNGPSSKRMLFRTEYDRIFGEAMGEFQRKASCSNSVIIVGTDGIGKSCFRFYILWKWLHSEKPDDVLSTLDKVMINFGENYFVVHKDKCVHQVTKNWVGMKSLGLMDPCEMVAGKDMKWKLVFITTSVSPLIAQAKPDSLSQRRILSYVTVMEDWPLRELKLIHPQPDPDRLKKFTYVENEITYCVPRWFFYTDQHVIEQLNACISVDKRLALRHWLISDPCDRVMDCNFPFRIVSIRKSESNSWEATRFISDSVCKFAIESALQLAKLERAKFLNMADNPFVRSLFNSMFKNWVFAALINGTALTVNGEEYKFRVQGTPNLKRGRSDFSLAESHIYRAEPCFSSIDGCGCTNSCLLLLQVTMSPSHSDAEWIHFSDIVKQARQKKPTLKILMVYVIPKGRPFRLPNCPSVNKHGIDIVRGEMPDDFFAFAANEFHIILTDGAV